MKDENNKLKLQEKLNAHLVETDAVESMKAGQEEPELTTKAVLAFFQNARKTKTGELPHGEDTTRAIPAKEARATESKEKTGCHYFGGNLAKQHGVKEAIVLRYLAYKVRKRVNKRDGKHWYYDSIEEMATRFLYIPRSTLADVLKRLQQKTLIEVGNYNRKKYDRTRWYSVPREIMDAAEVRLIAFNIDIASELGIAEAVIYENLAFYVERKQRVKSPNTVHNMSPSMLADHLPFSKGTIKTALKRLVNAGYIFKSPDGKVLYGLLARDIPKGQDPDERGQKSDDKGQIPDRVGQDPDEKGQKPDNDTHYITIGKPLEVPIEENTFKTAEATPPPGSSVFFDHSPQHNDKLNPPSSSEHGEAVTTNDVEDPSLTYTYEQLKENEERLPKSLKDEDALVEFPAKMCSLLISRLTSAEVAKLSVIKDENELLAIVCKKLEIQFDGYYSRPENLRKRDCIPRDQAEPIALSMMISALRHFQEPLPSGIIHSVPAIHRRNVALFLELKDRLYEHHRSLASAEFNAKRNQMNEEYAQRVVTFKGLDEANYENPDLAPATKARTFRNFVQATNASGLPMKSNTIQENVFKWDKRADELALAFFVLNRFIPPKDLFSPLLWCGYKSLEDAPDTEEFDPLFYTRRGIDVGFFLKHCDKIIGELKLTEDYGHLLFLPEEEKEAA